MKPRIGILGATGYTGIVLIKLLLKHPEVGISYLSSEQHAGKRLSSVYPHFYKDFDIELKPVDLKNVAKNCDLVFCATPNGFAKEFVPKLLDENNNIKIIDLSADFRLEKFLGRAKICYGLPELYRNEIKASQIIANPGCYPTSILLALTPAIKNKIIKLNTIIADSKSGVSGAGRQIKQELHFCEVNESLSSYNLAGKHRHLSEIENELSILSNKNIKITFSPHLIPVSRGILSTIYAELTEPAKINNEFLYEIYNNFYANETFVKIFNSEFYANTKNVKFSNCCYITPLIDERTNKLIIVSAIDNMVKGASGQAVQNMNILLSFKENLALDSTGNYL